MIKNDRQYRVSKTQIREFETAITDVGTTPLPPDTDPQFADVQRKALQSQLDDLVCEVNEYEALKDGRLTSFEAHSLDELPLMLVKARIARGMTHKELADRLNLREQQVQRWEANDYSGASIDNLIAVANALGVVFTQQVFVPKAAVTPKAFLTFLGAGVSLSPDFIIQRILPDEVASAFEEGTATFKEIAHSAAAIGRVFGLNPKDLVELKPPQMDFPVLAGTRFKLPSRVSRKAVSGYTVYAHYLAALLAQCVQWKPSKIFPSTAHEFFVAVSQRDSPMTFQKVVEFLWECGILVLPLADAGGFHGAVWKIGEMFVIVLKQSTPLESRWLFDALHETGHIKHGHVNDDAAFIEEEEISPETSGSEEEAANDWAEAALFDGRAEEVEEACTRACRGNIRYLKGALPTIAQEFNLNVGILANHMAYRLAQQNMSWWGSAQNLQSDARDPFEIAREILFERIDLFCLTNFDRDLLQKALTQQ